MERVWIRSDLQRVAAGEYVAPRRLAESYAKLGDLENLILWLERSIQDRDVTILRLGVDPIFDPFRDDPRFLEILRRVNLVAGG